MKPIKLTQQEKDKYLQQFVDKFKKELENFVFNKNESSITVKTGIGEVLKDKILIIFSQEAYLRMQALVESYNTEVGWYGLCDRIDEKTFRVYDVKLCRQYVDGGKVDTEDEDTLEFFNSLSDDEADHMHFQAHSHVNMSTTASCIDLQNQADVVQNMGNSGFYIFQIWNKKGDINTYLYDIDNNTFYDRKDIDIDIEDACGTISDFIAQTDEMVIEKKFYPYVTGGYGYTKKPDQFDSAYYQNYINGYVQGDW